MGFGEAGTTMTDDTQPPLFGGDSDELPPDPFPRADMGHRTSRIYVASTLTRLRDGPPEHARMVESHLDAITQAIECLHLDGGLDLSVESYAPIKHSSAHRHTELEPADVFRRNSLEVLANADGLIVYGWEPGAGVGQEFAWAATQVCIPILWLQHDECAVSRQIEGTPGDVEIVRFDYPEDLRTTVQNWVRSRRAVLNAGPHRRADRALRWRGPAAAACARWRCLGERDQERIAATGNLTPDVIDFYLSDPLLLAVAPSWMMDLLGVEDLLNATSGSPSASGRLATSQLLALAEAVTEYDWHTDAADHLRQVAEGLLAEPATRRLKLETPADWARFREGLES